MDYVAVALGVKQVWGFAMYRRVWVGLVIVLIICIVGFVWMSEDAEETTGVSKDTVSEAPKEASKPNRVLPKPKTRSTAASGAAEDVQQEQDSPEDEPEEDVEAPKDSVPPKKMLGAMSRSRFPFRPTDPW